MDLTIKQNDTKGVYRDVLKVDGVPVPLFGVIHVKFLLRALYKDKVVEKDATTFSVTVPPAAGVGEVTYQPTAEDHDTSGRFRQEWEVKFSDGTIQTFPNGSYNAVHILPDLGPTPEP